MGLNSFTPVDSLQLMAFIIDKCRELKITYNITKLQKLMYCCDGVMLATHGVPLSEERPEAWQYGPVFPKALRYIQANGLNAVIGNEAKKEIPEQVKNLIQGTVLFFGKFSASQLSAWSHKMGSPWYLASSGGTKLKTPIDDTAIKNYFKSEVLES